MKIRIVVRLNTAMMSAADGSPTLSVDSTGLGALVEARAATTEKGGSLPLVCQHERILKLFTITGLDSVFAIHPTVDAAVASVSAG